MSATSRAAEIIGFDGAVFGSVTGATPPLTWSVTGPGVHVLGVPGGVPAVIVRACIGLARPAAGRLRVFGAEPYRMTRRQRQRYSRQCSPWLLPPALLSNATLRAGIELVLLHDPAWTRAAATARVADVLAACGLEPWANARPADVPATVRIRASLARALATQPTLLVADDFTPRMNVDECASLIDVCRAHAQTVLIPTTAPQRIADLADSTADIGRHAVLETT